MTEQSPALEQAPIHPENSNPLSGTATNVIVAPAMNDPLQVEPQTMPEGWLVTVPEPDLVTARLNKVGGGGLYVKVADTFLLESITTAQPPVPEQSPLQPAKM